MTANNWFKGLVAGFLATVALSGLMLLKQKMGMIPELNPIQMLTSMAGASNPAVGWLLHFMIGAVVWGTLFVWLAPYLPGGSYWLKGVFFSIGAWVLMMVLPMPMSGAGLFGLKLGVMAPVATLVMHIIYGAVLGAVYGVEKPQSLSALQGR